VGARVVLSFEDAIVTEVELAKDVTVVGRHPNCDIVIDHPAISGRHMLFRLVNTTVYAEDLASTNGTKVNGLTASAQVVHHLDLIEVGRHKLHFFDDALLASGVGNLESTVLTEYERTMMVSHVQDKAAPRQASARRGDEDLSRTMAMPRDANSKPGASQEPAPAAAHLALRVVSGGRAGEVIALSQANTMIGPAGGDNALVIRRGAGYYLARFSGSHPPRLNRKDLGPGTHAIAPQDVIDVGGSSFEVIQVA
jgi:pSer/pThr/pTyr-binding forkhead associated (FHA) protein